MMHALKEPGEPAWKYAMKAEAVSLCISAAEKLHEYGHIVRYLANPPLEEVRRHLVGVGLAMMPHATRPQRWEIERYAQELTQRHAEGVLYRIALRWAHNW